MNSSYQYSGREYSVTVDGGRIHLYFRGKKAASLLPATAVSCVSQQEDSFSEAEDTDAPCEVDCIEDGVFRFRSRSSLWLKEYLLECDPEGFTYRVHITGEGAVGKVSYFGGVTEGEPFCGSDYHFCEYFIPCAGTDPAFRQRMPAALPFRSFFELLIPPPFCYSFRMEEIPDGRFGLGLLAKDGEYNFIHYDYNICGRGKKSGFYLSTDLEGHTKVNGTLELPAIRAFFGGDDMDVIQKYCAYHFDTGLCRRRDYTDVPRWWRGPIVCGWNEQEAQITDGRSQKGMATQDVYMKIAGMIQEKGISPTILIIDDKWQRTYGDCMPDPEKWPDMRAFTDEMHRRGIHTLLWFRLWGGEGLPEDEVMPGEGIPYKTVRLNYPPYADPTNEKYRRHLKEILRYLLSSEEGCCNCDGFKLDYSLVMPYGKTAKSAGGQYGTEMTKRLYKLIYETAKEIKPDALINGSPCHPYFAEVCDQARLHDYSWACRNETEQMRERAQLFDAAMPGILIDTDSVNFSDREDAMRFYRAMPEIGIPDIYQFSNDWCFSLSDSDWEEICKIFNAYSAKNDELYGPCDTK